MSNIGRDWITRAKQRPLDEPHESVLRALAEGPMSDEDLEALLGDVVASADAIRELVHARYVGTTSMRVPGSKLYRVHRITDAGRMLIEAFEP